MDKPDQIKFDYPETLNIASAMPKFLQPTTYMPSTRSLCSVNQSITAAALGSTFDMEVNDSTEVEFIASIKQLNTANLDRWKRTFQAMRLATRKNEDEILDDSKENAGFGATLKSQAASVAEDEVSDDNIFEEITKRETLHSTGVISPDSTVKIVWDIIGFAFITLQAVTVPFKLGFAVEFDGGWNIFELIMDIYFMIDIRIFLIATNNK